MGARVNHPHEMQAQKISVNVAVESDVERFTDIAGEADWNDETKENCEWKIIFVLEHHQLVSLQVAHFNSSAKLLDVGVLLAHQPSDMREEKSALRVVGVSIGVCVFVVHPMIPHPLVH